MDGAAINIHYASAGDVNTTTVARIGHRRSRRVVVDRAIENGDQCTSVVFDSAAGAIGRVRSDPGVGDRDGPARVIKHTAATTGGAIGGVRINARTTLDRDVAAIVEQAAAPVIGCRAVGIIPKD